MYSPWFRRLVCPLAAVFFGLGALPAWAQCPPRTTVADTLYNADGSLAEGRISISWSTFRIGSCTVIAGRVSVSVVAGAFSVQLFPNDAASPAGTSYRVTYALRSGVVSTEYWVVPASSSAVALPAVRSPTVPVPTVMFSQSQVTNLLADLARKLELPAVCPAGKFLRSNGSAVPPQVECADVAGGGSGSQHQVNGLNLVANDPINFQDSATVAFTNPSAGNVTAALRDSSVTAAKLSVAGPSAAQLSGLGDANISAGALSANRISGTAVVQSRLLSTAAPLAGGGDLSADRMFACPTCEVTTSKGVANGYAALDAAGNVVQLPAAAQATPAPSRIPLSDASGKIADGWLSSNVSLLGNAIEDAELAGNYSGIGACTNQFVRALNDNAAPTCASVGKADAASTFVHSDQSNSFAAGTTQDFSSATALLLPRAAGAAPGAEGDCRYDTAGKRYVCGGGVDSVAAALNRTRAVVTSASDSYDAGVIGTTRSFFNTSYTMPANFLSAGKVLEVCWLWEGTTPATQVNFQWRIRANKNGAGGTLVELYDGGSQAMGTSRTRGHEACLLLYGTQAPATSATVVVGFFGQQPSATANTLPGSVTLDTTAAQKLEVSVTFSGSTSGNIARVRAMRVKEIN